MLVGISALTLSAGPVAGALPTNDDPSSQIRFDTSAGADAKRAELTDYIWPGGLPTSVLPTVTLNAASASYSGNLSGVDFSSLSSVDVLDANVSGMDLHSLSYLMHPKTVTANANRLAIVCQGHQFGLAGGLDTTANRLLQAGFSVLAMQMPITGWNTDDTIQLPGGGTVTINGTATEAHGNMSNLSCRPNFRPAPCFASSSSPWCRTSTILRA